MWGLSWVWLIKPAMPHWRKLTFILPAGTNAISFLLRSEMLCLLLPLSAGTPSGLVLSRDLGPAATISVSSYAHQLWEILVPWVSRQLFPLPLLHGSLSNKGRGLMEMSDCSKASDSVRLPVSCKRKLLWGRLSVALICGCGNVSLGIIVLLPIPLVGW